MLYFDSNATTPPYPEADKVYREAQEHYWQNPSSPYASGARAHLMLNHAREELAHILDCDPKSLIFNSGATEGNFSLFAWLKESQPDVHVAVSAIEHPCVLESVRRYFPRNHSLLPVDAQGLLDLNALKQALEKGISLVSLMAANNETGALQPWREALELCRSYGVPFHCDAAQWLGKKAAKGLGACDFVTGCAHKFGGPRSIGFIKVPPGSGYAGQSGGGQEGGHRSGTENYPAVAAMVAALKFREYRMEKTHSAWALNRSILEQTLREAMPGLRIISAKAPRLANTSCLLMPRESGARWVARMDKRGACLSTGSACASGKTGASHVLTAMGLSPEEARRSVRISATWDATPESWRKLAELLVETGQSFADESNSPSNAHVIQI